MLTVTGPTVVIPLLRQVRPTGDAGSILKWEGIVVDPIGAILAVLVLDLVFAPETGMLATPGLELLMRFAIGATAGAVAGFVLARLLAVRDTGLTLGGTHLGAARDNPVADLRLEVHLGAGDPYETIVREMVPRLAVGRLVPGNELAVRVDPDDRHTVLVDWDTPM